MTILVTGGAGFIGSNLCEQLLKEDEKVLAIDNFDPFYNPEIKRKNIKKIKPDPNFKLIEANIRDKEKLEKIFEQQKIHKIIHLAARAGVRKSVKNPHPYKRINIGGTLNLLETATKHNIKNFIYGSSSSIYGKIEETPFKEDSPKNPISPYAASKLSAETYCKTYSQLHDLNTTILRFFTVYGPRQRPQMAIHKFTRLIEKGKEIPMYGDGTSKRDYTYIDDVITGIIQALEKNYNYQVFNIGTGKTIQLKKLIQIIEEKTGKEAKINQKPSQEGDVPITYADITKAKKHLNYEPKTTIEEGIEKFVKWYETNKLQKSKAKLK